MILTKNKILKKRGKMEKEWKYYKIEYPTYRDNYVYSATEMEKELIKEITGKTLRKVYMETLGYKELYGDAEWRKINENTIYCAYIGGMIILVFDDVVLTLLIRAEGIMEYKLFKPWEIKVREIKSLPTDVGTWHDGYDFFRDLSSELEPKFESQIVEKLIVEKTDMYPFSLTEFDERKADEAVVKRDLPASVLFVLTNNCILELLGDDIEYYQIKVWEKTKWEKERNVL